MTANEHEDNPVETPAENEISVQEILKPVWIHRKRILLISFVVGVVTLGINFLIAPYYKATSTILPETEKSKLSALGQFADVARLAGVNVPGSEIARLYPSIITSETVLNRVIERKYRTSAFEAPVNLIEYFAFDEGSPEKNLDAALTKLQTDLASSFDARTGLVTLTIIMPEAQLAADVLNAATSELDQFMRSKRTGNATEQVKWIEVRLREVEGELRVSEDSLKNFREKNRRVVDSPQLLLEQERFIRGVQVKSTVYIELKKQFELAKLEEIKNLTIVNILDPARPAVEKTGPKRRTNAAIMFMLSLLGTSGYYVVMALYGESIRRSFAQLRRS